MTFRLSHLLLFVPLLSGCALLRSTPEETPPPALSAREIWTLPPAVRAEMFSESRVFVGPEWLNRLVCANADQPAWTRTFAQASIERYEVDCFIDDPIELELDLARPSPAPPAKLRLLDETGVVHFRAAVAESEKKNWDGALKSLDAALEAAPGEPVYRLARLSVLYVAGRLAEAAVEADALVQTVSSPLAWKYRALAMRDIGLPGELLASLEGLLECTPKRHPLYAEAVCARGLILIDDGKEAIARRDLEEGCELKQAACCARLKP